MLHLREHIIKTASVASHHLVQVRCLKITTTGVIKRMTQRTVYSVIDKVLNNYYLKQLDYSLSASMRDKIVTLTSALFTHAN